MHAPDRREAEASVNPVRVTRAGRHWRPKIVLVMGQWRVTAKPLRDDRMRREELAAWERALAFAAARNRKEGRYS